MSLSNDQMNKLVLDYFIHEGYQRAAVQFSKELNVDIGDNGQFQNDKHKNGKELFAFTTNDNFITNMDQINNEKEFSDIVVHYYNTNNRPSGDLLQTQVRSSDLVTDTGCSTISQRQEIKVLILNGEITEAIRKISQYFPMILDLNNLLHFKLLRLSLVEMIRNHKFHNTVDQSERDFLATILLFVRENLINKVSNLFKLLKELEITMSLLCFRFDLNVKNLEDQVDLPEELKNIFNLSLRNQCYRLVNQAILNLHGNIYDNDTLLEIGKKEVDVKPRDNLIDDILEGEDELNQRKMSTTYHSPKFAEFDLSNLAKCTDHHFRYGGAARYNVGFERGQFSQEHQQNHHHEKKKQNTDDEEAQEEDDDDDDDEYYDDYSDDEITQDAIEYTINTNGNFLYQKNDDENVNNENSFATHSDEGEISKLTNLSFESRLEKVIKLWILTEQRMVDFNLSTGKNLKNIILHDT